MPAVGVALLEAEVCFAPPCLCRHQHPAAHGWTQWCAGGGHGHGGHTHAVSLGAASPGRVPTGAVPCLQQCTFRTHGYALHCCAHGCVLVSPSTRACRRLGGDSLPMLCGCGMCRRCAVSRGQCGLSRLRRSPAGRWRRRRCGRHHFHWWPDPALPPGNRPPRHPPGIAITPHTTHRH